MTDIIDSTARTPSAIAAEIRFLDKQAAVTCLQYIIEIGRRLVEAKAMVGDGNWLQYIKTELPYDRSTAQNYIRLYERYGTGQTSMFGSFTESQTFGKLTYTKALALLQVPEEDLEEFAQEHDLENMSTRELQQAIRERDEALRAKDVAAQLAEDYRRERDENIQELIEAQDRGAKAEEQVERLTAGMVEAADKLEAKDAEVDALRKKLEAADQQISKAEADLKKAKEHPEIPAAMMDQLRAEAEVAGAKKAMEQVGKELEAAERQRDEAQQELQKMEQKLADVQKATRLGDPDAAVFKSIFEAVQMDFNRLCGALMKVRQSDPETGAKLTAATKALLDKLGRDIGG